MGFRNRFKNTSNTENTENSELQQLREDLEAQTNLANEAQQKAVAFEAVHKEDQSTIATLREQVARLEQANANLEGQYRAKCEVLREERQKFKQRLTEATKPAGIRKVFTQYYFNKVWNKFAFLKAGTQAVTVSERQVAFKCDLVDDRRELYMTVPTNLSFADVKQAMEILAPVELPTLAESLGLAELSPKFWPCYYTETYDNGLRDQKKIRTETLDGIERRYDMTLQSPAKMTFAVFVEGKPREGQPKERVSREADLRRYAEEHAGFEDACTDVLVTEDGTSIMGIKAPTAYYQNLRRMVNAGEIDCKTDLQYELSRLRDVVIAEWQEQRPGLIEK